MQMVCRVLGCRLWGTESRFLRYERSVRAIPGAPQGEDSPWRELTPMAIICQELDYQSGSQQISAFRVPCI